MSFIYSLIALEPDVVLSEHTNYQGNFLQIMRVILQKSINKNEKIIIEYDNYSIYLLNDNKIRYLTLTESVNATEAFAFLFDLQAELYKILSYEKIIKLSAYQLNFKNELTNMMIYYNTHPSTMKTGESINIENNSKHCIQESITSIIEKENKISLIVIKESNINESETQREVFNIESAINEIKNQDLNTKQSKGYLAIAGGITAILILFYYII